MARLVLVGGGHAHLATLRDVRRFVARGHAVVLVSPDDHHYYSGMAAGLLAGQYRPQDARFNARAMVEQAGGRFIRAWAVALDPAGRRLRLSTGEEIAYDLLSLGLGGEAIPVPSGPDDAEDRADARDRDRRSAEGDPPDVTPVKPVAGLLWARQRLLGMAGRGRGRVVVIGGGSAGLEMAAGAWRVWRDALRAGPGGRLLTELPDRLEIVLAAGSRLLPGFPDKARRIARDTLGRRGALVLEGRRVTRLEHGRAWLDDGRFLPFDLAFLATGGRPPRLMRDAGLPVSADGALRVDAHLRGLFHSTIFGGGDCVHFEPRPLARVGVHAVRQGEVLRHNLLAALEGGRLARYQPRDDYLLVHNLGDDSGLLVRRLFGRWIVLNGRLAWQIKDWIDRRFMRAYQVSGEPDEPL